MKAFYSLKILAYRFFNTSLGKSILSIISTFVSTNLGKSTSKKFPFLVSITIDTESGYVEKNDHRVWQYYDPEAYIGYYRGIENWRKTLNSHNTKATFFLSTNCFDAQGSDLFKIKKQLRLLLKEGHEIGLHMHPDSDIALKKILKNNFRATSANFYNEEQINDLIKEGKKLIKKSLKIDPISFRWGNWALNTKAVKALEKNGFKIDSSATPYIKGHKNDIMEFDWSKSHSHYPWYLSRENYRDTTKHNSNVLEIPIATFSFLGIKLRADPANSNLLDTCFDYYYANADRSKAPFTFVIISHSIEGTHKDGSKTKILKEIESFISHAKKRKDVKFVTLKEAYSMIK